MAFKTKLNLWIGLTEITENQYWQYFDDNNGKAEFCKQVGLDWLNQDFMGYFFSNIPVDIEQVINETPEPNHHKKMLEDCLKLGIKKANAMFYYWGENPINSEHTKKYNTLFYIGAYDWN